MSEIVLNATLTVNEQVLNANLTPIVISNVNWGNIGGQLENQVDLIDYLTALETSIKAYTNTTISDAVGGITSFDYEIVDVLPQEAVKGTIYMVANGQSDGNLYDEYLYVEDRYELIGNGVDLTGYATEQYVQDYINSLNATNTRY